MKNTPKNFFKNYLSTLFFLLIAYFIYTKNSFHIDFISVSVRIDFLDIVLELKYVFYVILALYVIFLVPLYYVYSEKSKARIVLGHLKKTIKGDSTMNHDEKTALLAWVVKLFFAPLMIVWLTQHIFTLINNWHSLFQNFEIFSSDFVLFFTNYFFWTAFTTILFFDVFFFTIGYLVEMPALKNKIKSVEPTLIWWAVAILCYPPFNSTVTDIVWWYSTDFPKFENVTMLIGLNVLLLVLMSIYARASLALWFKASNLTNRWIVVKGPYKYVRHPAYICKNTAWVIGSIPMIYAGFVYENTSLFAVLLSLLVWIFLYYMRAITEENHLSADPEYRAYKKKVRYKFIPGIY